MNKRRNGFTVIELLFIIVLLGTASVLFFVQRENVVVAAHDTERKTAINAMYYSLEEVFYTKNQYYPLTISGEVLPSVDPALFTDPSGNEFGTPSSEYRYEPTNCDGDKCKSYTLRTTLQGEAEYVKTSQQN